MNKLGFGFLRLPKPGDALDWDALCQMTDCFLAGGGRYFDTCYTYLNGNSELGVKKCVAERYPRDQFLLAEKLPGYLCKKYEDAQDFFDQELARCGVEYFDVFMLHWLNGKNYQIAQACQQFRFLSEKKAEGRARRIGFSYHDSADLLEDILTAHPEVDVVQLQINYLDWDSAGIESHATRSACAMARRSSSWSRLRAARWLPCRKRRNSTCGECIPSGPPPTGRCGSCKACPRWKSASAA